MFLAASPYFQHRFHTSQPLLSAYLPTLLSVSTVTNLLSVGILTKLQSRANYPNRTMLSLILNVIGFTLLALSTVTFRNVSPGVYFGFLMTMVFLASLAAGLCQNGIFAHVSGYGVEEYTQAIMAGQAVAGVLPCLAQIISVLSIPSPEPTSQTDGTTPPVPQESGKSAFAYFLTATVISCAALLAFVFLLRRHPVFSKSLKAISAETSTASLTEEDTEAPARKVVGLWTLFLKLKPLASAVFLTFAITMFYPVFTQQITSVHAGGNAESDDTLPPLLQPSCFIPLAFLLWNTGDLTGRLLTLSPSLNLTRHPRTLLTLSITRIVFIPLYFLCNIQNRGAAIKSDYFYLVMVQFAFGVSNGYLGSSCMMGAAAYVEAEEREAAGGFMGLCLVGGLTAGSLLSFAVA